MSDEGEKTCPLCAEEMDLTDQQLRPCKCGYQVCVWCWHHIMEMAEKDETEGRCPACRTPYNKEKIVGMAANCGRLVSETNMEKKLKSQKGKSKTSEGRKQLASVRVVQRNLVYVVGLPLNFADEDLLQRKEYFGQYGKVMKVSISRTAAGSVQHFANSTCSVYITYSKEEEAVRCIQSVHGFVLDGRPLRACFGTTKYCHAWLRNMPCSNPDCLYLHENGSQEDSFTKDEIISAYTRCRVQNITGTSNNMQRRSGNVLPPPADEYDNISSAFSGKPITKTAINSNISSASSRVSPPNSSSGRSAALPAGASWGSRPSSNQPMPVSTPFSNGPLKHKPDTGIGRVALSTAVASPSQALSLTNDTGKQSIPKEESPVSLDKGKIQTLESTEKESDADGRTAVPDIAFASRPATLLNRQCHASAISLLPPNTIRRTDSSVTSTSPALETEPVVDSREGNMDNICSDVKVMSIHENQQLHNAYVEHSGEQATSLTSTNGANATEEVHTTDVQSDFRMGIPTQLPSADLHEMEDDLLSFDKQRIKDPEVAANRISDFSHALHLSKHSFGAPSLNNADGLVSVYPDRQVIDRNSNLITLTSNFPNGHPENAFALGEDNIVEYSNLFTSKEKMSLLGRYDGGVASGAGDLGESSIISNILSMDFDPWDESLTSPQHLAKLLTDKQGSFGAPSSLKIQNSNQSRFSFARDEEPISHVSGSGQSFDFAAQSFKQRFGHDSSSSNSLYLEKFVTRHDIPVFNSSESDPWASSNSPFASNKTSVSRSQISAPPGFSGPSRAPPPANHMLGASSMLRNQHQTPSIGNTFNNDDIEFMDPAILAVGKGTLPTSFNNSSLDIRSNFCPQLSAYGDGRFESFLHRNLPPQQNQRFVDTGDNFSSVDDAYRLPSRVMEQTLANNFSPLSQFTLSQSRNGVTPNGQWDGWNEIHNGGNLGMAELFRPERSPFNKLYGGYEDAKIRMPNSGNLYNGTYGI